MKKTNINANPPSTLALGSELEATKTELEAQIARDRAELPALRRRLKAFTKLLAILKEPPNALRQARRTPEPG